MKKSIQLHVEPLWTALITSLFSILYLAFNIVLLLFLNDSSIQLNALLRSDYEYSLVTQNPVGTNDYYLFNASIEFAPTAESGTRLNADVIMQTESSSYTDIVRWNAKKLSSNSVAISRNLARSNDIKLGDKVYSKHIVTGEICEYTVEEILSDVETIRVSSKKNNSNGIVIMSCDEAYIENISHRVVVFSKCSIDEFEYFDDIIYRDDEISNTVKTMIPYAAAFVVFACAATVVFVIITVKKISNNIRRLIILGCEKKRINKSFYRYSLGVVSLSVIIAAAISSLIFIVLGASIVKTIILLIMPFIELVTLLVTEKILNKQLWRK